MFKKVVLFLALVTCALAVVPVQQQQDATALQTETQPLTTSYRFGYNDGQSTRSETRDLTGNVIGSYSYIGPDGVVRTTHYTAGADGYNVVPAPQLPQSVGNTVPVSPYSVGSGQQTATTTTQTQNLFPYSPTSRVYGSSLTPSAYGYLANQYLGYQNPATQSAVYQAPSSQLANAYNVVPVTQYTTGHQTQSSVPTTQTAGYQTIPSSPYYTGYPTSVPTTQYTGYPSIPTAQFSGYRVVPTTPYTGYQYPVVRYA